ncbi:MAG: PAS domain S-box protein, partial [SAR202 cluster bacterium]|nr:PAS domain S-box protein [SAR202 cluster bacterium]
MLAHSLWSVRSRFILLMVVALLPMAALLAYDAYQEREDALAQSEAEVLRLAWLASANYETEVEGARELLTALAQVPALRRSDIPACNELVTLLLRRFPDYANVGYATRDGNLGCSGLPLDGVVSSAERTWFQRAAQTREFATGDFQIGTVTRRATVNFGYPVLDEFGGLAGVAFVALDLERFNVLGSISGLPEGATLAVLDQNGTIMSRYPDFASWVGHNDPDAAMTRAILGMGEAGTFASQGFDGVERVHGLVPVESDISGTKAYVFVGIPRTTILANAGATLRRNGVLFAAAVALAIALSGLAGERFIMNNVRKIAGAVRRVTAGDLSARSGVKEGRDELSQLARSFDAMTAALQAREKQIAMVFDTVADPIFVMSIDGEGRYSFSSVNTAFSKHIGVPIDGIIGKRVEEIVPEPGLTEVLQNYGLAIQEKRVVRWEGWGDYPAGRLVADAAVAPVFDDNGRPSLIIGSVHDLTVRKKMEEELQEKNARLEATLLEVRKARSELEDRVAERTSELAQANARLVIELEEREKAEDAARAAQMEATRANRAKSDFLSRMSHELRTPLNSIMGFTQLLEFEDLTQSQKESLAYVSKAGNHLLNLINEVLDITRIEAGRMQFSPEPVHLAPLLREMVDLVQPLAQENRLSITIIPSPLMQNSVTADLQRLKQVLLNMLSNAIKYNKPDGSVTVSVAPGGEGRMRIGIADTGRGISREKMARLFNPFDRLDAEVSGIQGTGLGLALSKSLMDLMGGKILVETKLDEGTT